MDSFDTLKFPQGSDLVGFGLAFVCSTLAVQKGGRAIFGSDPLSNRSKIWSSAKNEQGYWPAILKRVQYFVGSDSLSTRLTNLSHSVILGVPPLMALGFYALLCKKGYEVSGLKATVNATAAEVNTLKDQIGTLKNINVTLTATIALNAQTEKTLREQIASCGKTTATQEQVNTNLKADINRHLNTVQEQSDSILKSMRQIIAVLWPDQDYTNINPPHNLSFYTEQLISRYNQSKAEIISCEKNRAQQQEVDQLLRNKIAEHLKKLNEQSDTISQSIRLMLTQVGSQEYATEFNKGKYHHTDLFNLLTEIFRLNNWPLEQYPTSC